MLVVNDKLLVNAYVIIDWDIIQIILYVIDFNIDLDIFSNMSIPI